MMIPTPGPWVLAEEDDGIAVVAGDIYIVRGGKEPHDLDNAHLIAAAPELLEACEAFLKATELLSKHFKIDLEAEARAQPQGAVALGLKAVAKARGAE